jgi:hypothetical protein
MIIRSWLKLHQNDVLHCETHVVRQRKELHKAQSRPSSEQYCLVLQWPAAAAE